ncbi:hypothetical protein FACS189456_6110 [Bacteroidia bacterium]|nr:hypothetical protein FACS189456_6110 [Bacteroidia bacterium]GHU94120.1 hypothetical protein FACS1894156_1930 [Bacteroidia bacterium]
MIIRHKEIIEEFAKKHADIVVALQNWVSVVELARWNSHNDLKAMFPSADYVGNGRYVFNIKGNSYRMVVVVFFANGYLNVRFVGTHAEYDKINCTNI